MSQLADRQREVVRYLALGLNRKEIAERMGIAVSTVGSQVDRAVLVIGSRNEIVIARWALLQGIVTLHEFMNPHEVLKT